MPHRLDKADPRLTISDVYLFKGKRGSVFVMNLDRVAGSTGFHPEACYEFKIDTDGDAIEDITYRAVFTPKDPSGRQRYVLSKLTGKAARDREEPGDVVAVGRTDEVVDGTDGLCVWGGSARGPVCVDGVFVTAVRTALATGTALRLGDHDPRGAINPSARGNVTSIVLELPPVHTGSGHIGFWATTALPDGDGGWVQINRAAKPLVDTLFDFTEGGTVDYNAFEPSGDDVRFGARVEADVAAAVTVNQTVVPYVAAAYGSYVRAVLFPDVLHYEVGTDAYFGASSRNGRGLTEPTPEAMLEIVLNKRVPMNLTHRDATGTVRPDFPYLATPV